MAKYILSIGGRTGGKSTAAIDAFEVTETEIVPCHDFDLKLSKERQELTAVSCGKYVFAMGGYTEGVFGGSDVVDIFENTGTKLIPRTYPNINLSTGRFGLCSASCNNFVLAMSGYTGSRYIDVVDAFEVKDDSVIARTDLSLKLSAARGHYAAISCGNFILAVGGWGNGDYYDVVDVFEVKDGSVIARTDLSLKLSVARADLSAVVCGNFILVTGGESINGYCDTIDVFEVKDGSIIARTDLSLKLSVARHSLAAVACGNLVLVTGGRSKDGYTDITDVFENIGASIVARQDLSAPLSVAREGLTAAASGKFVLAMGGFSDEASMQSAAVDAFEISVPKT